METSGEQGGFFLPSFFVNLARGQPSQVTYQDLSPDTKQIETADYYIYRVHLPGFKTEDIKVQANKNSRKLMVRGRRTLAQSTVVRAEKDFYVPHNTDLEKVVWRLIQDWLTLVLPKKKTQEMEAPPVPTAQEDDRNKEEGAISKEKPESSLREHTEAAMPQAEDSLEKKTTEAEKPQEKKAAVATSEEKQEGEQIKERSLSKQKTQEKEEDNRKRREDTIAKEKLESGQRKEIEEKPQEKKQAVAKSEEKQEGEQIEERSLTKKKAQGKEASPLPTTHEDNTKKEEDTTTKEKPESGQRKVEVAIPQAKVSIDKEKTEAEKPREKKLVATSEEKQEGEQIEERSLPKKRTEEKEASPLPISHEDNRKKEEATITEKVENDQRKNKESSIQEAKANIEKEKQLEKAKSRKEGTATSPMSREKPNACAKGVRSAKEQIENWRNRIGEIEEWFEHGVVRKLMEGFEKNRDVIIAAVAAFSVGLLVSKLRSSCG